MEIANMKLTQTQQLLLNALISMFISASAAGSTAAYQSSQGGSVNLGATINIGLTFFLACIAKSLYDFVPGHTAQIIQALQEELQRAKQQPLQGPLVVVHTSQQAQQPQIVPVKAVAPLVVSTPSDVSPTKNQAAILTTEAPKNVVEIATLPPIQEDTSPIAAVMAQRQAQK